MNDEQETNHAFARSRSNAGLGVFFEGDRTCLETMQYGGVATPKANGAGLATT